MARKCIQSLAKLLIIGCCYANPVHASPQASDVAIQSQILSPYKSQIESRLNSNQNLISDIASTLTTHSLPIEFVLIPMLESSYDPLAISHANAAGLWQLMPNTAKRFGLEVSDSQDQRFHVQASTNAAILYLQFLYTKFGELSLTLAAYNSGEGRVSRAINQAGSREFDKLHLPAETRQYVHRFYALKKLIAIEQWVKKTNHFYLFGQHNTLPLIDLSPLPPLVTL